jgi:acetylornithine deacetylase/succinyl-diaminopimelate desuccinylase-like protein
MYENIDWVKNRYEKVGFQLKKLESSTLPVLFAQRILDPTFKTVLFYFHLDGQAVNPKMW